jgi:hypothetical protein
MAVPPERSAAFDGQPLEGHGAAPEVRFKRQSDDVGEHGAEIVECSGINPWSSPVSRREAGSTG